MNTHRLAEHADAHARQSLHAADPAMCALIERDGA